MCNEKILLFTWWLNHMTFLKSLNGNFQWKNSKPYKANTNKEYISTKFAHVP